MRNVLALGGVLVLAYAWQASAAMESANYRIDREVLGPAGGLEASANYQLHPAIGDPVGGELEGSSYQAGLGLLAELAANVPAAPTVSNPASYYNKLDFIVTPSNNASDAEFAIAISDDDFATTQYIQNTNVLGANPAWQTYTNWGGATGETVLGLDANTTYSFKVKARQGDFTETGFGPSASVATVSVNLTFDLDIGDGSHTNSAAPYSLSLQELTSTAITDETTAGVSELYLDLTSNAADGVVILVSSAGAALTSASTSDSITSSSTTLSVSTTDGGYGLAADEESTASSGALTEAAPFNVFGTTGGVGGLSTSFQTIFTSGGAPITGGDGKVAVRAVAGKSTSAADDYTDTLTLLAVPTY